jgi:hypothetical protein
MLLKDIVCIFAIGESAIIKGKCRVEWPIKASKCQLYVLKFYISGTMENAKVSVIVFVKAVIQTFNTISIAHSGKLCHGKPN